MQNNFTGKLNDLERKAKMLLLTFPSKAGDITLRFIDGNFKAQGFQGITFMKWAIRKAASKKDKRKGRAILVNKGRLRRGFRKQVQGAGAVAIINDVEYARVHNEGLQAGRGKGFNMPKRQMIPTTPEESPVLVNAIRKMIIKELNFQ
jgi:phage gpG-like protein